VFCGIFSTDSDFFFIYHKLIGFYNRGGKVYSAVRTDSLYKADYISSLKGNEGMEILLVSIESSFITWGSKCTGVRRLPLHPIVHYDYFMLCPCILGGPDGSVGIATDYGLEGPGSNPVGDEIFCPSRPALGPTQPPIQWE